jgi:hypothetical protein
MNPADLTPEEIARRRAAFDEQKDVARAVQREAGAADAEATIA